MNKKQITRDDILALDAYIKVRNEKRQAVVAIKKDRRVAVGPHAMFFFENFETMRYQVQEMLYIEKGGDEQLTEELDAYNPLIPQGNELVATVMFEIPNAGARKKVLSNLGGVEETMYIQVGNQKIFGVPEQDVDRTNAEGKASSVQFVHFIFDPEVIAQFKQADQKVVLGMDHPEYAHSTVLSPAVIGSLAKDFD